MNRLKKISQLSLKSKMLLAFCFPTILLFIVNLFLYFSTIRMIGVLDEIYDSNMTLNQLSTQLDDVQLALKGYLNTRTSDALENYYSCEQDYRNLIQELDDKLVGSKSKLIERNIKKMSLEYLTLTNKAVESKRGGSVEKYKQSFDEATRLYGYVSDNIYSLNNRQFLINSRSYNSMMQALQSLETLNMMLLVIIGLGNLIFVVMITPSIVDPLREQELLMQSHLKDAQLKYLQAQINPHFLFNTLNAGAQLAMMEGAENTGKYIEKVADFFRYNIKKNHDIVTLADELDLVDIYIYILNVRFAGDIHFEKEIDTSLLGVQIPSMILQPIVENSVNYGIRNIEWQGKIKLKVYRLENNVCVSISDNGVGIEAEKIERILAGNFHGDDSMSDSNGVGLDNCINRLSIYYGRDDVMDIISEGENKGTETILYLPIQEELYV